MKQIIFGVIALPVLIIILTNLRQQEQVVVQEQPVPEKTTDTISGTIQPRDTMDAIFTRLALDKGDLAEIVRSSREAYNLAKLSVGNSYFITVDKAGKTIQDMQYEIDDLSYLSVRRTPEGFTAEKVTIPHERREGSLFLEIKSSVLESMPSSHKEYVKLALELSDIYAWDIDFMSDIREGDTIKVLVEELWAGEIFIGFGKILAAEFVNNGKRHEAYRFAQDGHVDYFDGDGRSLRKTLLRSPLKFKYISSSYSRRRFHPVLRIYRPHLGVDYAAPTGTPVSAAGNGKVMFAGYKGQNGKMVRIRHNNGFETYYGHLSRIRRNIRKGVKVSQGDIIGYVGSTGLSTGPHLDYRMKKGGRFVNPLKVNLPRGKSVTKEDMADFRARKQELDASLSTIRRPVFASSETVRPSDS